MSERREAREVALRESARRGAGPDGGRSERLTQGSRRPVTGRAVQREGATRGERGQPRHGLFLALAWLVFILSSGPLAAGEFEVESVAGERLTVRQLPAQGDELILWFTESYRTGARPSFQRTLERLRERGSEIWLVDLLESLFLPRTADNVRQLDAAHVRALIDAALERTRKRVVLVAGGQMAIPVLKGLRDWQSRAGDLSRVDGAILFFPTLHAFTPVAGDEAPLEPIVAATNYPVFIFQPERGQMRGMLADVQAALLGAGSPAYVWLQPGVRDWYFMHHDDEPEPASAQRWIERLPAHLEGARRLLRMSPKPTAALPLPEERAARKTAETRGLVAWNPPRPAPGFELADLDGKNWVLAEHRGAVLLVNFWASWCPPCVEEIPSMNRLAKNYPPERFQIISINFRETAADIRAFQRRILVEFPVLLDLDAQVAALWRVFAFPSSFLIDADGRIRYSVNSAIAWDDPEVVKVIDALVGEAERMPQAQVREAGVRNSVSR